MKLLNCKLPATACFCAAGYLCANGKEGWGWFLLIGLLLA